MSESVDKVVLNRVADLCQKGGDILAEADRLTHSGKIGNATESIRALAKSVVNVENIESARHLIELALLTQSTRNQIAIISPALNISEKDIKEFCLSECQSSPEFSGLNFQSDMAGQDFYDTALSDEAKLIRASFDEVTDYRIKNLSLKFEYLSPHIRPLIYLLYGLMQQAPHQRIETIKYWLKSFEEKPENLALLQNFLGVFGDISQYVYEASQSNEVLERSRLVLAGVLEDTRLANSNDFNPFEVLKEYLMEDDGINPWILESSENTPFDAYCIGNLLDPEVPRKLLAMSAAGLNQPELEILNQRAVVVFRQYEAYQNLKKAGKIKEAEKREQKLLKNLQSLVEEFRRSHSNIDLPGEEISQKVAFIRKNISKRAQWVETEITGNQGDISTFHPLMVMLRLVDAEKIVHRQEAGQQFRTMMEGLQPFIEQLYNSNLGQQEECGAALARSVDLLLNSQNPHLDVPLKPDYKNTLRELVILHIVRHIPEDIRNNGAYTRFKDKERLNNPEKRPLLSPQDLTTFNHRNFNSAMLGSPRTWVIKAAELWINAENRSGTVGNTFEKMLKLAAETLSKYYKARSYESHFYSSATVAAIDVFPKLVLPEASPDDYIIGSTQEYSALVDEATKILEREAPNPEGKKRAEFIELNHPCGRAKTAEELLSNIDTIIKSRGRPPRMLLLSSKTRYGDAVAIHEKTNKNHFYALTQLIKSVRSAYPKTCIAIDGCQSVGRNDLGENLDAMNPDLFFNSAAKALGIHNCGILMIQENFQGYPPQEDRKSDLKGTRSTIDLPSVVATNLALKNRMGRFNTWFHPVVIENGKTLRDVEIERLITLTEYALQKTNSFSQSLIQHIKELHPSAFDAKLENSFLQALRPQVAYPSHQKRRDYNGVLSIGFPGVKGERLSNLLSEHFSTGSVTACLRQSDAIRISFLPSHTTEDIDQLFMAVESALLDEFSRQIKTINPQHTTKTKTDLEVWRDKKMHKMPVWEN